MKTSGLGLATIVSLALSATLLAGCGGGTEPGLDSGAAARVVKGTVSKGPIRGATVTAYLIDDMGFPAGEALASATTNSDGLFTLSLAGVSVPVLVVSSGGTYLDESDPAGLRQISLTAGQGLSVVLPAGQTSAVLTPFTDAVVRRARRLATPGRFIEIYNRALDQATGAFGLNPVTTVPTNPVNPAAGASVDSQSYGVLLGGFANVVNSVAIRFGRAAPDFTLVETLIDDLSDGLDGLLDGDPLFHTVDGVQLQLPSDISINNAIARFRNNQHAHYPNLRAPQIAGASAFAPIVLPNDAPIAVNDAFSVITGGELVVSAPGLLVNDFDADGDALTVALVTGPTHGSLSLGSDGGFTYTDDGTSTVPDSFVYSITDTAGESAEATVTITIGALPSFSIADASVVEGQGPLLFDVTRGSDPAMAVGAASVPYTVSAGTAGAADATLGSGTLEFPDGVASAQISVDVTNDAVYETAETLTVMLGTPDVGSVVDALATGTIQNDDPVPVIAIPDVQVSEGAGTAVVTITRTGATEVPTMATVATIGGTASGGDDFVVIAPVNIIIAASQSNATLSVVINDDVIDEPDETFAVLLSGLVDGVAADGSNATQGTVTILDDDSANTAPVANATSLTVTSGQSVSGQLTGSDADGNTLTYKIVTQPTHGGVVLNATTGSFTYTSNTGYVGADQFTFAVNDGVVDSTAATVAITVQSNTISITANTGAVIPTGTWHAIRPTELRTTQLGTAASSLSYTVTNQFAWKIYQRGSMTPVTSFSQAQIEAGNIVIAADAANFNPSGATGGVAKVALRYPLNLTVQGANGAQRSLTFNVDVRDDAAPVGGAYNHVYFSVGYARLLEPFFGGHGEFGVRSGLDMQQVAVPGTGDITFTGIATAAAGRATSIAVADNGGSGFTSAPESAAGGDTATGPLAVDGVATFAFGYRESLNGNIYDRELPSTVHMLPLDPLVSSWTGIDGLGTYRAFDSDGDSLPDALYPLRPERRERNGVFSVAMSAEPAAGVFPVSGEYGVVSLLLQLSDTGTVGVDLRYLNHTINANALTNESGMSARFVRQIGSIGPASASPSTVTFNTPFTITQGTAGDFQFPYDFDADGTADLTFKGAMGDRRTVFAASGASGDATTASHALALGVLRPVNSAGGWSITNQTFRIRALELSFLKAGLGSSVTATSHDSLQFAGDGTVSYVPAIEGVRAIGRTGPTADVNQSSAAGSSATAIPVTYGDNGMLQFALNGRTITGFLSATGDTLVLSALRDDSSDIGAGLWLGTHDVQVSTNHAPDTVTVSFAGTLPETGLVPNNAEVMLAASANEPDGAPVDANFSWYASAGSFADAGGNATTQGANIVWTAPATGSGRTLITAQYSDGEYADVGSVVVAWGADSDGDMLADAEETSVTMTDPNNPDSDNDFLPDGSEVLNTGTDPNNEDTEGDGVTDGADNTYGDPTADTEDKIYVDNATTCTTACDGSSWATALSDQTSVLAALADPARAGMATNVFVIYKGGTGSSYGPLSLVNTTGTAMPTGKVVLVGEAIAGAAAKVRGLSTPTVIFGSDGTQPALTVVDTNAAAFGIGLTLGAHPASFGGGISASNTVSHATNLDLVGIKAFANSADYGGGLGIDGDATFVTAKSSQFVSNTALYGGGGIYANNGTLQLDNSRIADNTYDGLSSGMMGGGIYVGGLTAGGSVSIFDSAIHRNSALGDGGGIAIAVDTASAAYVDISNSEVYANVAGTSTVGGDGGGLAVLSAPSNGVYVTRSSFLGNTAVDDPSAGGNAGGILLAGSGQIANSEIVGNRALYYGGGIAVELMDTVPFSVSNSRIVGNRASVGGGGVYLFDNGLTDSLTRQVYGNTIAFNEVQLNTVGTGAGIELDTLASFVPLDLRYNAVTNNDDGSVNPGGSAGEDTTNICAPDGSGGCLFVGLSMFDYNATGDTSTNQPAVANNQFGVLDAGYDHGLRLDQVNSPLVDAGELLTPSCDPSMSIVADDCSTAADGSADVGSRDIGVHFPGPAPGPINDLFEAPLSEAVSGQACANVIVIPVRRDIAGDPSSPAKFLENSEILRIRVNDTLGTHADKYLESLVTFDPVSDGSQGVLAQSVAPGQFEFRICATGGCPSSSSFSNIPIAIEDLAGNIITDSVTVSTAVCQ